MEMERRFLPWEETEVRVKEGEDGPVLEGYTAVFDSWSEDLGGFREKIRGGAFAKTLKEADVRALKNHDPNFILARNKSGSLELREDDKGLHYSAKLDENISYVSDLIRSIQRGDISGNSFAFRTVQDSWNEDNDERELVEVKLYDVGPVVFPAYPNTSVGVRDNSPTFPLDEKFEALNGLLFRLTKGLKLRDTDLELLDSSIQLLQTYIPEEIQEPLPEEHSEEDNSEPLPEEHSADDSLDRQAARDRRLSTLRRHKATLL